MRNSRNRFVMLTMALRNGIQGTADGHSRDAWQTALALVSSAAFVACDGTDSSGPSRSESSVSSASTSSPDAAGTDEGEPTAAPAAYRRFWAVSWDVDKRPAAGVLAGSGCPGAGCAATWRCWAPTRPINSPRKPRSPSPANWPPPCSPPPPLPASGRRPGAAGRSAGAGHRRVPHPGRLGPGGGSPPARGVRRALSKSAPQLPPGKYLEAITERYLLVGRYVAVTGGRGCRSCSAN